MENVIKVEVSGDLINLHPKSSPAWKTVWLNVRLGLDYILDLKAIMVAISQGTLSQNAVLGRQITL